MSKFKVGDIVTGKYENHWVYGFKWRIKSIEKGYDHLTYEDIVFIYTANCKHF